MTVNLLQKNPPPLEPSTLPSVKYRQFIFKNLTTVGSSSSDVEDRTLWIGLQALLAKSASLKKKQNALKFHSNLDFISFSYKNMISVIQNLMKKSMWPEPLGY